MVPIPHRLVPKSGIVVGLWANAYASPPTNLHGSYAAAAVADPMPMKVLLVIDTAAGPFISEDVANPQPTAGALEIGQACWSVIAMRGQGLHCSRSPDAVSASHVAPMIVVAAIATMKIPIANAIVTAPHECIFE